MSHTVKKVTYTVCDKCGREAEGYSPPSWFSWMVGCEPGEIKTGKLKHHCPRCTNNSTERMEAADPPG